MKDNKDTIVENVPLAIYAFLIKLLPSKISSFFRNFFFSITPDVPYDLSKRIRSKNYRNPLIYGYLIGLILCFVVIIGFCLYEGVLYPDPEQSIMSQSQYSEIMFFSKDWVNIIMYTLITPATFSIGLAMLSATIKTWGQLENNTDTKRSALFDWKGFVVITIILAVSSIAIANYMNDVININNVVGKKANEMHFWFLGDPLDANSIKPITIYYTILNFLILVFTLTCVAIFVTAVRPIMKLSSHLSKNIENGNTEEISKNIVERLSAFADVYLFAKSLLAITMLHSIVWSYSPLALTSNFNIERGFILFVSIFFIAIPRLHFEFEWFRTSLMYKERGIDIEPTPKFIRGFNYYAIWVADFIIIGTYFMSVFGLLQFGEYRG